MVFSSVVASLINKFLSPFVDELTSNQLNVFAWSGKVSLTDVSVKPNAFDSLKLPFRVIHGHIGRIEASVPWMNIYTEPIVIKISDVYVVSIPNSEIKYDEEEEKRYEWNIKKAYLENIELMKQKIKDEAGAKNEDDGFVMKLIVAAVKNVQIFINNVHVCYEDSSSYRNNVFQIGLSFSSLIFETETNKTNVKYTNDQIIHKLVKLEGFSIYLNSKKVKRYNGLKFSDINNRLKSHISKDPKGDSHLEYILCPINFISEATIHRKPEIDSYKIPIIDLVMNLESFYLQVTNYQIHTLLLLLDSIERMRSAAPYRKWRPSVSIKRDPLLWWKFIYTSIVETGVRRKKREFSWQSIHEIGRKRKIYTELYRRKLLGENVTNLEDYEKDLNLITIVMARSRAEMDTKEILDARKEKAKRGWLSGWWSSSAPKNNEVIKDIKEEFTSEEKDKLYKAIGYDENSLLQLYPPEFIAHRLSFKINLFKILVQREKDILMDIEFNHSKIEFFNRPSSGNIFLKNELDSLTIIGANNVVLLKGKEKQELLKFKFEMNPLDKQFDFSVDLKMKSSYILYDIDTINHLYLLFKPPKNIMEEIQSYAHDKFDNLKQMTALGLEYAVEKHKQMKLNIDVDPSFVIVPKLAQISNASTVLLLSLGKFLLTSKLVPKSNVPKVKDMIGLGETAVMEEMMKLIYEKYTCHIQNVQVILSDNENWKADINNLDTERHMLYPFELTLNISRSIIPQDPHFAKLIIYGELPVIDMRASDAQISLLLALIVSLPFGPTINEFTITNDDSIDSIAGRSYTAVKTVNMPKLNVLNDEVTDAFMYATKNLEKVEEPKSKQSEVDGIDSSKAKSNNSSTSLVVYKDLIFEFKLKDIFLTIFQLDRLHESSLAKFHLDKFSLYGEMLTDNTLWMNCSVSDLIVYDIRYGRKEGGIRTILKKSRNAGDESKSILTIYIAQKIAERIIVINMSRFSFILALDYMMAVIDTSTKAFVIQEDVVGRSLERISSSEKTVQRNQKQPTKGSNVINIIEFDLSKMEVFILESLDLDRQVAEACAFTCFSKINIRVEPTEVIIKGEVSKIMMALVDYLEYINKDDVKAYIMAPIDLTINGSIKDKKQVIDLNFSDINITISPHMVSIILSILSTMGSTTKVASSEIEQKDSSISMINYMKPIDRKVWYLNCTPMANEALDLIKPNVVVENLMTFSMNSIKILINSSGLMSQPLIRFSMTNHAKLSQNKNFVFKGSLAADYFNNSLNTWEPLIEPINNEPLPLQGEIDLDETCKKISIETKQNLELLLTKSSINSLAYFTSIKSYPTNEYWKWIVQINDIGSNAKEITFRSNTQIVNMFNCPFNLYTYDMNNSKLIGKIEPSSTYYLPLKLVYGEELLYIRPSEEFAISDLPVDWRSIDLSEEVVGSESCIEHICNPSASHKSSKKYLVLTCPKKKEASHQFKIKVRGERFNVLYEDTERLDFEDSYIYNIRFIPFVRLKNLLPYSIMYFYEPVQNVQVKLEPGDETNLPFAQFGTSRISYQVLDYLGYDWIASEVLPQSGRENENHYYEFRKIVNFDEQICLAVNYSVEKSSLVLSLFSPYWMMNLTNRDLTYKIDDKHVFTHPKNLNQPLLFCADPSKVSKKDKCSSSNQTLRFRFTDCDTCSKEILLASSSQTLLKLGNDKCLFVEVDVTEFEGTIKISDYFDGAAPVLIVNDLDSEILYGQKGVVVWDKRSNDVLNAKHMVLFCWTEPKAEREFVFKLHEDDEEQSISLDYDQYVKINDNCGWVTFFDGKQRTDEITKPKLTFEIIMKGLGINIIDNEKKKDFLYLTINSTSTWEERKGETKHFKELSIKENNILEELYQSHKQSLSNNDSNSIKRMEGYEIDFSKMIMLRPRLSFLRRASNRGMWFLYSSSDHIKQYHMKINRIQIDNQLPDHIFDVAFSPVIVPKSVYNSYELQQKSFIEISAIIQSLGSVTRYKYLQILIQEFMIQLDWGWICHIMNLFNIEASKEETTKTLMAKDLENIFKDRTLEIVQKFVMRKTYYDYLLLGPLKAHLSVTVGDLPDGKFPFGFDFIIRFTGQTIGEINDTLFKLDYFERKMVFLGDSDLQAQIIDHYKTQIFMQFYKLILGLDIIGNPMKLVLGFKKGVGDFFYEPAMGIIHGPEEFAEGIATGVKSLATNVIGGTAGALGRIGNRLGTGVAALTIDEKFQKDRRERINRKVGFAESGRTLFRGFYNGLTGVITKPIEGAQKDGVEGLFKGVGRGVVGIFAQPAASVIDFASGSLQAFNNVIDPKQVAQPIRPARNFRSGRQISPYVLQSAIGNEILRTLSEGKYINEEYEFHVQLNSSSLILLTKMKLLSLKKTVLSNVWDTEWIENWSNCERVERMNGKLRITIKDSKKTLLLFSGAKDRIISTTNDDHIKISERQCRVVFLVK
ncbi:hypothetical protein RDWZM_003967 [Blomia tropicalis]|uniref:Vacuolar protein sorting-associated protein 13A n=1 Tax=Blomia tropicalis TaxID=40697 RepID=A0A9Q0MJ78_BLOTA|nr:hypothetical protein RDWZM_003967 [Blomia tropicalis]